MDQLDFIVESSAPATRSGTLSLVADLKGKNEDFEFYPTTESQIKTVTDDLHAIMETHEFGRGYHQDLSILDIGAGDGRVLESIKQSLMSGDDGDRISIKMYAIEKASLQINGYRAKDINLIGTDFHQINFISKSADIAYVNPPYSEYSHWVSMLISQMSFKVLYAVIPERWEDDAQIKDAMERRGIVSTEVLAESDFLDGHRQARAKVQVVRFAFNDFKDDAERVSNSGRNYKPSVGLHATCPFQIFIEDELGLKKTYSDTTEKFNERVEMERVKKEMEPNGASHELMESEGVLKALIVNYENRLAHVLEQYKHVSKLDPVILQELGVQFDQLVEGLKEKLFGYRSVYWKLLFTHLDVLSSKLTAKHKQKLLNTLSANALDFTEQNAVYIISFAVEMANELIEESVIDVFKDLTCEKSISRHYVSNEHMYQDKWRHNCGDPNSKAKYLLDYRFIYSSWANFGDFSYERGLKESAREFTNDLCVMFNLLGYSQVRKSSDYSELAPGGKLIITGVDPSGKSIELLHIKYYKNGSRHLKFDQQAMLRFNVTASRVLGWVRDKSAYEAETAAKKPISDAAWAVSNDMKVTATSVLALTHKQAA